MKKGPKLANIQNKGISRTLNIKKFQRFWNKKRKRDDLIVAEAVDRQLNCPLKN